jgi:hypothetical protein
VQITNAAVSHDHRVFALDGVSTVELVERSSRVAQGGAAYALRVVAFSVVGVALASFGLFVLIDQVERYAVLLPLADVPVIGALLLWLDPWLPVIAAVAGVAIVVRGLVRRRVKRMEYGIELVGNGKRQTLFWSHDCAFAEKVRGLIVEAMQADEPVAFSVDIETKRIDRN